MDANKWMPKHGCQTVDAKKWSADGRREMTAAGRVPNVFFFIMDASKMDANKYKVDGEPCDLSRKMRRETPYPNM